MSTPRGSTYASCARRSKSAGSSRSASVGREWSSQCLVRPPAHELEGEPEPAPTPRVEPCDVPIVSVTELCLFDEVTIGCSSGSVRLEGLQLSSSAAASGVSSKVGSPTTPRRPELGMKFIAPFGLRDPVLVRFGNGRIAITRVDGERKELCAAPLTAVSKIVRTVTGVTIVAEAGFTAELSIHEEPKADALVKLLHAKTRGAPPPKDVRPVTRPLRTKSRVCGASVSSSRASSVEPEVARKGPREALSAARDRTAARNGEATPRHVQLGSAGEQAEADRERRRQELYRQLTQLKRNGVARGRR